VYFQYLCGDFIPFIIVPLQIFVVPIIGQCKLKKITFVVYSSLENLLVKNPFLQKHFSRLSEGFFYEHMLAFGAGMCCTPPQFTEVYL
jgi:hypothetical protein